MKTPTHVIIHFKDTDTSTLARFGTGMAIASRQKTTVGFGEDPRQQQQRVFIDKASAANFLVFLANADWTQHMIAQGYPATDEYRAVIEDREGDKRIVSAGVVQ